MTNPGSSDAGDKNKAAVARSKAGDRQWAQTVKGFCMQYLRDWSLSYRGDGKQAELFSRVRFAV